MTDKPKYQSPIILSPEEVKIEPNEGESVTEQEVPLQSKLPAVDSNKKGSARIWLWSGLAAISIYGGFEAYQFAQILFNEHIVLGALFSTLLAIFGGGLGASLYKEFKAKNQLDRVQLQHRLENKLDNESSFGKAEAFLQNITQVLPHSPATAQYKQKICATHNDQELIQLFADTVLVDLDQKANEIIARYAAESAVMVALSPLALLDMLLILWRNQRMVKEISHLYGLRGGVFARAKLLKYIAQNLLYAGTSEMLTDAGADMMGGKFAANFSMQLAQGLGAGIFTARLGIQTVKVCRPLQKPSTVKLTVSQLRIGVIKHLKSEFATWLKRDNSTITSELNITEKVREKDANN